MLQRTMIHLVLGIAALSSTACTTTDDPRKGGFISGVVGLSSGSYQQRIDEREKDYASEQHRQEGADREAEALTREYAALEHELVMAQNKLKVLEAEIARSRQRAGGRTQTSRLRAAQHKSETIDRQISRSRGQALSIDEMRRQSRVISAEIDELDSLVDVIKGG